MTTQRFVRTTDVIPAPPAGGGKIKIDPPITSPVPPTRSIWGVVFPFALLIGVVGVIAVLYASGARQIAGGIGMFGGLAAIGMVGSIFRRQGAGRKLSHGELTAKRRAWFAEQDDNREVIDVQRRKQWENRRFFHWEPEELLNIAGSARMWDRMPGDDRSMFGVVRVGVGKVKLGMQLVLPDIARPAELEPATGHALRRFINAQQYVDGMPKAIWLQRFPGIGIVGDLGQARAVVRAMLCQLAAFHSPTDVQVIIVSSSPAQWEWSKWLPHVQHSELRDGCGERRLLFDSPAALEMFLDQDPAGARQAWSQPSSSFNDSTGVLPLRIIVDDCCGTPEDWAGLTGATGYAGTCFVRIASSVPPRPAEATIGGGAKYWVGFSPETLYRIENGVLRKSAVASGNQLEMAQYSSADIDSDELNGAFYAVADQVSTADAERFARTLARYRAPDATVVGAGATLERRTLLDALGIDDPRRLDVDRLWAPTRFPGPQSSQWMRFPIGVFTDTGEIAYLNLREGSQGGMGMHGLFVGTTGAGKTEGLITEVASACLTHAPDVLNIVFTDFKLRSAAGWLEQFPHVVAAVSNLAEEQHLVGRLYETLDGELDRRGKMLTEVPGEPCVDVTEYNQRRQIDPNLPAIPALWVITDEYNEVFADPIWGPKFRKLYLRIARQGRSLHVFLKLVGQEKDTQNLRKTDAKLGYVQAGRMGNEEEARTAIQDVRPAHIPESGFEGTCYLRVAMGQPREFRFFYSSAEWTPRAAGSESTADANVVSDSFVPRLFTAGYATDVDNRLDPAPVNAELAAAAVPAAPVEQPGKLLRLIVDSLRAADQWPPRPIWLPVLNDPEPVDALVNRWRGRPWYVDYGNNSGLSIPVALADYPREIRQDPYCLNLLQNNALIVCAPKRGATTAVMTMVAAAALLHRPERVQFYCVAASGPQLSRLAGLPHVVAVAHNSDSEGVRRVVDTVNAIAEERDRVFTVQNLDMDKVRAAKFASERGPVMTDGELKAARAVSGGDIVLVIDGWKNFSEKHEKLAGTVQELMRARNYGIRVVYTHTSTVSGLTSSVKAETGQTLELKLVNEHESVVKKNEREMERSPAKEVPDRPGRGVTADGHHMMVGFPRLTPPPGMTISGAVEGEPHTVEDDQLCEVVRRVAGTDAVASVARLPERILLRDVVAGIKEPLLKGVVPFGAAESNLPGTPLGTAVIDFFDHQHAVATGLAESGLSTWVRAMLYGIMNAYDPNEATIILVEHRRANVGVVPPDTWLNWYGTNPTQIAPMIDELCQVLERRRAAAPQAQGVTAEDLAAKKLWSGKEFFVVIDGLTAWSSLASPVAKLANYVGDAEDIGLHVVATADIRHYSVHAQSSGVIGKMAGLSTATLVMNGARQHGQIVPGVYAEPQRQGKGQLVTRRGVESVLVGWTEPPAISRRR